MRHGATATCDSDTRQRVDWGLLWAYVGVGVGAAVSIWANILHSCVAPAGAKPGWSPPPGSVTFAAFWPLALFVAIEILARSEWPSGWHWQTLRFTGLTMVAAVAAVVSYRHMSGLFDHWDEDVLTVRIGPLAIDGLMTMGAGALLSRRYVGRRAAPAAPPVTPPKPSAAPVRTETATPPAPARPPARKRANPQTARDKQRQAVALLADGRTPAEVALQLQVSKRTVERWRNAA